LNFPRDFPPIIWCASRHLHEELGAMSFSEWCETALGISPRRARYLISLDRRIRRLPQIADAYRRGTISWCQVRHLFRIAIPETERRWIHYARQVTLRRLEETIAQAEIATTEPSVVTAATLSSANRGGASGARNESPRHMCAPSLPFDDRPGCDTSERADRQIRFWLPTDVAKLWREALAACRWGVNRQLDDWHCLIIMIDSLSRAWDSPTDRGWKRRYRIFERDGWQCRVPGCTSRANLNEHHIVLRSRGGSNEADNLVTLCVGHHQRGIHDGQIRCSGTAPDDLWWELGVRSFGPPLLRCRGDRIIRGGRPLAHGHRATEVVRPESPGSLTIEPPRR
jgi:hypothetical protein